MGEFINTIDLLGDDVVIDSLIEKSITEYRDNIITSIGSMAFAGCKLLKTIELPNVDTLGSSAFYQGCETKISLPSIITVPGNGFSYSYFKKVRFSNVEAIQKQGLHMMGGLIALILDNPEKICVLEHIDGIYATQIDGRVSAEAQKNKGYIYVPRALIEDYKVATNWSTYTDKFRAIEDYTADGTLVGDVFDENTTEIFDDVVTSLGAVSNARFKDYTLLESVNFPELTTIICDNLFKGCSSLKDINLPNLVTASGSNIFNSCTSLEGISLPKAETLGMWMFANCSALINADLPALKTTGSYMFLNCNNLKNVNLPSLVDIGAGGPFYGCSAIEEITLPLATSIKINSFRDCINLRKLDLPSITSFSGNGTNKIFGNTPKLAMLILRSETVCTLSSADEFTETSGTNSAIADGNGYIYVPKALVDTYKTATNWSVYASQFRALEDYTVDDTITGEIDESKI